MEQKIKRHAIEVWKVFYLSLLLKSAVSHTDTKEFFAKLLEVELRNLKYLLPFL